MLALLTTPLIVRVARYERPDPSRRLEELGSHPSVPVVPVPALVLVPGTVPFLAAVAVDH